MTPDNELGGNVVELAITRCDGSVVRVTGKTITLNETLALLEDGLRGAGFHVPLGALEITTTGEPSCLPPPQKSRDVKFPGEE